MRTRWIPTAVGLAGFFSALPRDGCARLAVVAFLVLVGGCGKDGTASPPPSGFAPPTDLAAVNRSDEVILTWRPSPNAADADFQGYVVYRHTSTMVGATEAQLLTYRRNSAPLTALAYTDGLAQNGTRYVYAVRAQRASGELSPPTGELDTAPRREGAEAVVLGESAFTQTPSGLNCATPRSYEMRSGRPDDNRPFIDCYLGTVDSTDATDQALALKSPDRFLNGSPAWVNRKADLLLLGSGQEAWDIPDAPASGWGYQVELGADPNDKVIALRTPPDGSGHRHYAKLWILSHGGSPGTRTVSVRVAYQEISDYPRFVGRG